MRTIWFSVVPAALALAVVEGLAPLHIGGARGPLAALCAWPRQAPLAVGGGFFFLFAFLARIWRFYLPGGRFASGLPPSLFDTVDRSHLRAYAHAAELHGAFGSRSMRRRCRRLLTVEDRAALDRRLDALWAAIASGDEAAVGRNVSSLRAQVSPVLRAKERIETAGFVAALALAAGAALFMRGRLIDSYTVLSGSMLPTLAPGDRLAASKLPYREPRRGDVVVFSSDAVALDRGGRAEPLVKRVIGLPGDRIGMVAGSPVINGWRVPNCDAGEYVYTPPDAAGPAVRGRLFIEFLDERSYSTLQTAAVPDFPDPYVVPAHEVFVLGDNRGNSADSRVWNRGAGGGLPTNAIAAQMKWFLSGNRADGRPDLGRLFHPIDGLAGRLPFDVVDTGPLQQGVARCLANRPRDAHPPAARASTADVNDPG